jgi:putative NADPH-quinone reductase
MTQIAIIQGHPDSAGHHLLHALADAYAEGAIAAGHEVRRIEVAKLEFRCCARRWISKSDGSSHI